MRLKFCLLACLSVIGVFFATNCVRADDACKLSTPFSVILKNVDGTGAAKIKVEVYQQDYENGNVNKPLVGKRVLSGSTDSSGKWVTTFTPVRGERYVIKVYENNADNGDFWYFDQQPSCGSDFELKQTLPRITIILRDYNNNLIKFADISLYSLHTDADGDPVTDQSYLVGAVKLSAQGKASYYVAPSIPELTDKTGSYFLQVKHNNQLFNFPKVRAGNTDVTYEYTLSGLGLTVNSTSGRPLGNATVNIYKQNSDLSLGAKLFTTKTDVAGKVSFEYPTGIYALSVTDDFRQENIFYNVSIASTGVTTKNLTVNYTRFYLTSVSADSKGSDKRNFQLYSLTPGDDSNYYKNKSIGNFSVASGSETAVSLAAGPYLAVYKVGNQEYGRAFMATNNEQRIGLSVSSSGAINSDEAIKLKTTETVVTVGPNPVKTVVTKPVAVKVVNSKFKGYVVAVNGNGGLWYINKDGKRWRLDGSLTYDLVKSLGVGISNPDLTKIPLGIAGMYGVDTDKDGLSDSLETALGTNINKADSDGDKFSDLTEVKNNFNPLGKGSLKIDKTFAAKQKGRLFIQVQNQKQLWYISPRDGKRYFLFDAYNIQTALYKTAVSVNWSDIAYLPAGN